MITKKTIKKIKGGDRFELSKAFDFLLDSFNENAFDQGYACFLNDIAVYSDKLTEAIYAKAKSIGKKTDKEGEPFYLMDRDKLQKTIEDYFTDIYNNNKNGN